jgi:hypothetical protein
MSRIIGCLRTIWVRLLLLLGASLMLASCFFMPNNFASTLEIRKDQTFTFRYSGELRLSESSYEGPQAVEAATDSKPQRLSKKEQKRLEKEAAERAIETEKARAIDEKKMREIVAQLRSQAGFNKVEYLDKDKLLVDYTISGKLTHGFVFPYDSKSGLIVPFMAVEIQKNNVVSITMGTLLDGEEDQAELKQANSKGRINGSFEITTDAAIVQHNAMETHGSSAGVQSLRWTYPAKDVVLPRATLTLQ